VTRPQPAAPPVLAPTHPVDVFVLLIDDNNVLLGLRAGTGYADGQWAAPSGKLELGEDAVTAIRREAAEEIGVHFDGDEPYFAAIRASPQPRARPGRSGLHRHAGSRPPSDADQSRATQVRRGPLVPA
jgi:8-oxo-dGTP diphosphatase